MAQASHLSRYRPAVLSVATIAAAYGIYTLYAAYSNNHATSTSLRRSNAVHRPRRERERERHAVGIDRLPPTHDAPLGLIILRKGEDAYVINLATTMFPTTEELQRIYQPPVNEEMRQKIAVVAVELILLSCLNSTTEPDSWDQFRALGFAELVHAMAGRDANEIRGLAQQIPDILQMSGITEQQVAQALNKFFVSEKWLAAIREGGDTEPAETEDMDGDDGASKEPSHGLRGLLYYIAEEDAKRKAYEHRGIRCEECSEMPIRGIRYHCLNCPDYDLCASCEQHTEHVKTHVFAKIKIPLPILSQPTKEYRLWYPGDPRKIHESLEPALRKRLCHDYGYEEPDIDALYDQFMANANVPFPHATISVKACIDRRAFNKALTRDTWTTCFASNPIYDRMYAFYDTDMNGVIDFEEFVSGVSYLRGPKRFATLARAIRGYDMDGNGFVDRSDFTRLLRAKYEIQQQLVSDMVEGQEIEQTQAALETLQSSQPISSVFSQEDIPPGEIRARRGKHPDMNGDLQPNEGTKTILENDHPWPGTSPTTRESERRTVSRFAEMIYGPFDGTSPSFEGVELDDIDGLPRWDHTGRDDDDDATSDDRPVVYRYAVDRRELIEPHIPDIIWQTVEDGLNELLNKMFKAKEDEHTAVEETRAMRKRWSKQIADAREEERRRKNAMIESAQSDPLVATAVIAGLDSKPKFPARQNGAPHMRRQMVPTDTESLERREREISAAPLEELLDTTGFSVRDAGSSANVSSLPRAAHIGASSIWNGSVRSQATSPLRTMISTDDEETVDPTLPQNRPNAIDTAVPNSPPIRKGNRKPPALPERPPSHEQLRYLADLDDAEQQSLDRGGPGRLSYTELEGMAVADTKGELRGLIKSWLEYASF